MTDYQLHNEGMPIMIIGLDQHMSRQHINLDRLDCELTGYYQLHAGRYYWQLMTPDKSVVWSKRVSVTPPHHEYETQMI